MTTATEAKTFQFAVVAALTLGNPLEDGTYGGITTQRDGTPVAVVYLGASGDEFNHDGCVAWARERNGELVTRAVFHLLRTTIKDRLPKTGTCFTADLLSDDTGSPEDASYAWICNFSNGFTDGNRKSCERQAVAVRLIPLEA